MANYTGNVWLNNSATFSSSSTSVYLAPTHLYTEIPLLPPPKPLTEVERLLADVAAVCALGRAA